MENKEKFFTDFNNGLHRLGRITLIAMVIMLGAIPFVMSAVLIDKLKGAFSFIKRNYGVINWLCGGFLLLVGIMMMTGTLGKLLAVLS